MIRRDSKEIIPNLGQSAKLDRLPSDVVEDQTTSNTSADFILKNMLHDFSNRDRLQRLQRV
jgi:hypothetical protein